MQLKRLLTISLVFVLLALVPLNSPGFVSNPSDISNDALTSGEINGVSYSYGDISYEESGNQTIINEGSMSEFRNITRTEIRNVSLIMDTELTEIYFHIKQLEETDLENRTSDLWRDQAGLETWFDYVNNTVPLKFNPLDKDDGWAQMKLNITANFTIAMASAVSDDWRFLGEFPVNTTYFEYFDKTLAGDIMRVSGIIIPEVFAYTLTEKVYELEVTNMKVTQAFMAFFSIFSRVYNISASAYQVNITNGVNLAINVNMFDTISANYTEYAATYLQYFFLAIDYTQLKFTNNDSIVDWQFYPRNMLPVMATSTGTIIEAGYRKVETKLLSTFQAITAAFATVEDSSTEESTSIQARLAIWGIQTMTSMVAFDDANNNDKLDLELDSNGIGIASQDRVSYIGLAEAFESKEFTAYYRSHNYTESLWMPGYGLNITNSVNQTDTFFNYEEFGFGDVDADSTSSFTWSDPVEHDDGTVEFNFGVNYTSFPVTWVNMADGSTVTDFEDIAYHYRIMVNAATGFASISPTWYYGGLVDAGLTAAMSDLSLALILKSEFFAIQATYTATESNETVNATETSAFGVLGVKIGGEAATEIDVTGPKQYYTLGGTSNETASFDAITLIQVAGHFEAERTSPFNSESGDTAGTSSLSLVETLDVDFYYVAHLIVVTYPAWGGDSIVHDPDFNVNYAAPDVEEPVDDDTTTTTTTTTPVEPIITTAVDPAPTTPVPGFTIWMSIISIGVAVVFVRKSKY